MNRRDLQDATLVLRLVELGDLEQGVKAIQAIAESEISRDDSKGEEQLARLQADSRPTRHKRLYAEDRQAVVAAIEARESAVAIGREARANARYWVDQAESGARYRRGPTVGPARAYLSSRRPDELDGEALPEATFAGGKHRAVAPNWRSESECARSLVCQNGTVIDTMPSANTQGVKKTYNRRSTRGKGRKCRKA